MNKNQILVVGASGTVGSELVRLLKSEGKSVRVTTSRQPKDARGVHVNLATGEGIDAAFEGVDKAFILSPSGYGDQYKVLSPLIQAAQKHGLKKVVLMSALGANAVDTTPLRRAEIELERSGLTYNIVRPNWFMQNFNTFWVQGIKSQGKILLPVGQAKTSFIDARDISAVIAKLLSTDRFDNKEFDLTGPEDLTHDDVAREISAATGRKVVYQEIEPSVLREELLTAGLPVDYTNFLIEIIGFLKAGYNAGVRPTVEEILGRNPRTFKQYARDYKAELA